jgi:hypothetical protein
MPPPPATPTEVRVGVVLVDIIELNEPEETFEAEVIITAEWNDPRLAFDAEEFGAPMKLYQGSFQFAEVFPGWWPNLLILNEIGTGDVNAIKIEVNPEGTVRYKEQRNVTLETPMSLRPFPFDTQKLRAVVLSFGDTTEEVVLKVDQRFLGVSEEYAETHRDINIAQWDLKHLDLFPHTEQTKFGGELREISAIVLVVTMKRRPSNVIWKVIVPMIILVSLMWAVFWMDIRDLSDRLNISFIGILTIVAYQFLIEGSMPKISYFTFTDSILLFSFVVMCLTIHESLCVVSLSNRGRDGLARKVDRVSKFCFPIGYFAGLVAIYIYYIVILGP